MGYTNLHITQNGHQWKLNENGEVERIDASSELQVSQKRTNICCDGDFRTITITCSGKWFIEGHSDDWFKLSSEGTDKLTITANPNPNVYSRSGFFYIVSGKERIKFTVIQRARNNDTSATKEDIIYSLPSIIYWILLIAGAVYYIFG